MKEQVVTTTNQFIAGLIIGILFFCSVSAVVCPSARAAIIWSETYGGINDDRALSLVATSDGGYSLAGSTDSVGAGGYDAWVVKTDADGNIQWDNTYDGGGVSEYAYSLVQTDDGGYVLAGSTDSVGAGGYDFWLVKTERVSGSSTSEVLLIVVIAVAVICFGLIIYLIKIKK